MPGLTAINDFKNKFTSVRPNLFLVSFPNLNNNIFTKTPFIPIDKIKDIYIYCKASELPSSSSQEIVGYYFGRPYYEPGDRDYNTLDLTFYNSEDFAIRNFLERWMEHINKAQENIQIDGDPEKGVYDCYCDLMLKQLDRRNHVIKTYEFKYCFPVRISQIPLEFSQNNTIEEFTVSFRYQWWATNELTVSE